MNKFIEDNIVLLCDSTDPNDTFLDKLELLKVIPQEINDKIKSKHGDISKNRVLYNFLQTAGVDRDIGRIKDALKSSSNFSAYNIFLKQFPEEVPPPPFSQTNVQMAAINPKKEMKSYEIGTILAKDLKVLNEINTFYEKLDVSPGDVHGAIRSYMNNTKPAGELLREILNWWKAGNYAEETKGQHLMKILVDNGYIAAAETLRKAGLVDTTQIDN